MFFDLSLAWLIFPCIGICAGLLAGLLGIGGGMVLVPGLFFYLKHENLAPGNEMLFALGTSLACIVPTSMSATLAHQRKNNVDWNAFKQLVPGLLLGGLCGAQLANILASHWLERIFGILCLLLSLRIFIGFKPKHIKQKSKFEHAGYGGLMGSIAALTGIGGGALVNPYMLWSGFSTYHAVGTSAASVFAISSVSTLAYIFLGHDSALEQAHIGYVIWPAVLAVALFSVLAAPLGAKLAYHLPEKRLKQLLATLLLVVSIKFLL